MIGRRVISAGVVGAAILLGAGCAGPAAQQPQAASATTAPSAKIGPGPFHRATPGPRPAPARLVVPAFSATVSGPLTPGDVPFSWRPGCPVPPGELRAIRLSYAGFDGRAHTGEIIVNASVVRQVIEVFSILYRARFPISRMEPVDVFHGSDPRVHGRRQHLRLQLPLRSHVRAAAMVDARLRAGDRREHDPESLH